MSVQGVWDRVGRFEVVNFEPSRALKMIFPAQYQQRSDIPTHGESHFTSPILPFGVLPVDRRRVSPSPQAAAPRFFRSGGLRSGRHVWSRAGISTPSAVYTTLLSQRRGRCSMTFETDYLIVGAGVSGLAFADEL